MPTTQIEVFERDRTGASTSETATNSETNETSSEIPHSFRDVPIKKSIDRKVTELTHGGCHNNGQFNTIPGGVQMGNGGRSIGICCAKITRYGRPYMLHANHVFGCDRFDNNGQSVYQAGQYVRPIIDSGENWDWAIVRNKSGRNSFRSGVRYFFNGSVHPIGAWFTRSGLRQAMINKREIIKQGFASGYTKGIIKNMDDGTSKDCTRLGAGGGNKQYGVRTTARAAKGDSGGPMFSKGSNGRVVMIGHTSIAVNRQYIGGTGCGGADYYNRSIAMGFYCLSNNLEVQFKTA